METDLSSVLQVLERTNEYLQTQKFWFAGIVTGQGILMGMLMTLAFILLFWGHMK